VKRVEKEKELTPKPESAPSAAASKPKKKKKSAKSASGGAETHAVSAGPSLQAMTAASESSSGANDGAWTRVETRRRGAGATGPAGVLSDGLTTSVTGTEDEQESAVETVKQRTLAERLLPTGRKTGVEE
jgi:hypothetical protein